MHQDGHSLNEVRGRATETKRERERERQPLVVHRQAACVSGHLAHPAGGLLSVCPSDVCTCLQQGFIKEAPRFARRPAAREAPREETVPCEQAES